MSTTSSRQPRRGAAAAWCLVLLAAGLEIIWALALTEADGLTRPGWAAAGMVIAIASLVMLTLALRTLPLGSAYTVWVGLGAVGVALAGVVLLDEPLTPLHAGFLGLIVAGVTGLTLTDTPPEPAHLGQEAGRQEHRSAGER